MIPWLAPEAPFPALNTALKAPNGLLAVGGDLSPRRLLEAYRLGIFPWFNEDDPILWWSPDPRMVLFPSELKISRSLRKTLKKTDYEIRTDSAFLRSSTHVPRRVTGALAAGFMRTCSWPTIYCTKWVWPIPSRSGWAVN